MNTIRELKQQEKYKSMLKRKNKEKKIYKDKNASLQLEKQRLYIALRNKDKEIERLNNIINKGIEAINVYQNEKTLSIGYQDLKRIRGILRGNEFDLKIFEEYLQELKGVDKE